MRHLDIGKAEDADHRVARCQKFDAAEVPRSEGRSNSSIANATATSARDDDRDGVND